MNQNLPDAIDRRSLARFAWLSIVAAVLTIVLKAAAYYFTGSVGLLSDAMESIVNLVGALMALSMLIIAARPPDDEHAFGHDKAEYFSSILEGTLILVAAVAIGAAAVQRLMHPQPLEQIGLGLIICVAASLVNLGVGLLLLRTGKRHKSITLEANAHHLLTDVWTSAGVLAGVGAVAITGWGQLDPIVAIVVAGNIIVTGYHLVRRSVAGLMDTAIPVDEQQKLRAVLATYAEMGVQYHSLRTHQAGAGRFVSLHVLVPGAWTVQKGHSLLERIEAEIRATLPQTTVFTHLESLEDPASWDDLRTNG